MQGGVQFVMLQYAKNLKKRGHDVLAVLPDTGPIYSEYQKYCIDVEIIKFIRIRRTLDPIWRAKHFYYFAYSILKLVSLIKAKKIDLVIVSEISFVQGLIAGKIAGVKTICLIHTIFQSQFFSVICRTIIRIFSNATIFVSKITKSMMFGSSNIANNNCVIPMFRIDTARYDPGLYDREFIRKECGISEDAFVVGLVSKFTPNKGQNVLIEAAKIIRDSYTSKDPYFLFVGGVHDGYYNYYCNMKALVIRYELSSRVIFLELRNDIPEIIEGCDLMVHVPIDDDPMPSVIFEAMLMGKTIIASKSGGIPEQLVDGESGILINKNAPEELAEMIVYYHKHRHFLKKIGGRARQHVLHNFSLEKYFDRLEQIMEMMK